MRSKYGLPPIVELVAYLQMGQTSPTCAWRVVPRYSPGEAGQCSAEQNPPANPSERHLLASLTSGPRDHFLRLGDLNSGRATK